MLVFLKFWHFSLACQQTCHPRDKNYMILQWKAYVKWTSTFCEKTDKVCAPTKFQQNKHTPRLNSCGSCRWINKQIFNYYWYSMNISCHDQGCARFAEIFTFSSGAPANLSSMRQELHDSTMKGLCEMNEHLLCKNWQCVRATKIAAKRAHSWKPSIYLFICLWCLMWWLRSHFS